MPVPPPPPPPPLAPPPPPPPSAPPKPQSGGGGGGRNALLADIQRGARLRKVTQVNDRSAPSVDNVSSSVGASQGSSAGTAPMGPSLGGLFAGGFPTLRPIGQRDLAGKTPGCSEAPSTVRSLRRPLLLPPPLTAASTRLLFRLPPPPPPPLPLPPLLPPPPPPQAFQDRPANRHPPLPSCPPPPPPSQVTKPTWLPIQHSHHTTISQPSTPPPPPPPPPFQPPSTVPGDRSSGCFHPLPPSPVHSEPSRFPILRDSPLGPPPPPPPPPLPASFTPSCPSTLPPPPPKLAPLPSPAMRSLPPSYPCNAPTRRPPAVPRSAGRHKMAAFNCILTVHLPRADDFESKFQFHPVEDLPPPDEFKPFPRIYPSKENRGSSKSTLIVSHPYI
uniref:WH2 domain-containing protein n=1 Tax=Dicentrarchus labrax TaxID=13489 RepID=A0A8C4GGD7_DICLA